MTNDLLYQIALTLTPNIGPVQAKILMGQFANARAVFNCRISLLKSIEGIGEVRADSIRKFDNFAQAEVELQFLEKYSIQPLFITDNKYPRRLLNCYDSPTLLYYKGGADLNVSRIVAIIGSRSHTEYGKHITEQLINDLSAHNILVVSGLAFGIDAIAHKAALKNKLTTVAVLAHGLDQIYPPQHSLLAKEIMKNGGLLTEFRSQTNPDKHNFPTRNRIVAGMCDATIVIETGCKGGSMITAELANGYNRDVFAIPGKVTDHKSQGCNSLIKNNKAILLTDAQQLIELMGWEEKKIKPVHQKAIFVELSQNEQIVVDILRKKETTHIDELTMVSGLSSSSLAAAILNLELKNVIESAPGKIYRIG